MGCQIARSAISISPRLAVVPNRPAIQGRDMPGKALDAKPTINVETGPPPKDSSEISRPV